MKREAADTFLEGLKSETLPVTAEAISWRNEFAIRLKFQGRELTLYSVKEWPAMRAAWAAIYSASRKVEG